MEETLTRHVPRCRLVVFAFTLAVLLSGIAAAPAHAQGEGDKNADIFSWGGTVEVSTPTLKITAGESATYNLWLTEQPAADDWWVRMYVGKQRDGEDGVVYIDGKFDIIDGELVDTDKEVVDTDGNGPDIWWVPSVGWEFDQDNTNLNVATQPRGVTIYVADHVKTGQVLYFTHDVLDEDTNCPESLHGIASVRVEIVANSGGGNGTPPSLSIGDTPVEEGEDAEFTVTLAPASDQTVTVDYATADGTAEAGTDYETTSDTLTFLAGQIQKTIRVPTVDDDFHEPEERFRVILSNPMGATLPDAPAEGIISDNDLPELSIGDTPVEEGDEAEFTVTLAPASDQTVTVDYATADATAKAGSDYTPPTDTKLTFLPGQIQKTIRVLTVDDTFHEPEERFRVNLSNASGATLAAATAEGIISDDDLPELSIGNAPAVTEGDTAQFEVTLTPATSQTVTVRYATADVTTMADSDYTPMTDTLTFTAGETRKTISIETLDDMERESDERFTVTLSSPSGATLNDEMGEGTIKDDADGGPTMSELSIGDASVAEGLAAEFVVTLTPPSSETVTVRYATADVTTMAGSDYTTPMTDTLTFTAGRQPRRYRFRLWTTRTRNRTNASP